MEGPAKDAPRRKLLTADDMTDEEARWLRQSTYEKWPTKRRTLTETPFYECGEAAWELDDFVDLIQSIAGAVPDN